MVLNVRVNFVYFFLIIYLSSPPHPPPACNDQKVKMQSPKSKVQNKNHFVVTEPTIIKSADAPNVRVCKEEIEPLLGMGWSLESGAEQGRAA